LELVATEDIGDEINEMGNYLPTINLGVGRTALQVNGGEWNTCALLDNRELKCWGDNARGFFLTILFKRDVQCSIVFDNNLCSLGQLGQGSTIQLGDNVNEMGNYLPYINLGSSSFTPLKVVVQVHSTCVWFEGDLLKCFGEANQGFFSNIY